MMIRLLLVPLVAAAMLSLSAPAFSAGESQPVEAKADQLVRQMSDYLSSLAQFTFHADDTVDTILTSGQKLQMGAAVDVAVRRPDRLRVSRKGDLVDQEIYYDGTILTLYGKKVHYYATLTAPPTIDAALDYAREEAGLVAPASDLVYPGAYAGLMEDVESGSYVGLSVVGGVECHYLAFRGGEVDWQIWIETGERPLPRKYVITSKWITGAPQFTAIFTDWDTAAKLEDARFAFSPPKDAEKIEFLLQQGAAEQKNRRISP